MAHLFGHFAYGPALSCRPAADVPRAEPIPVPIVRVPVRAVGARAAPRLAAADQLEPVGDTSSGSPRLLPWQAGALARRSTRVSARAGPTPVTPRTAAGGSSPRPPAEQRWRLGAGRFSNEEHRFRATVHELPPDRRAQCLRAACAEGIEVGRHVAVRRIVEEGNAGGIVVREHNRARPAARGFGTRPHGREAKPSPPVEAGLRIDQRLRWGPSTRPRTMNPPPTATST